MINMKKNRYIAVLILTSVMTQHSLARETNQESIIQTLEPWQDVQRDPFAQDWSPKAESIISTLAQSFAKKINESQTRAVNEAQSPMINALAQSFAKKIQESQAKAVDEDLSNPPVAATSLMKKLIQAQQRQDQLEQKQQEQAQLQEMQPSKSSQGILEALQTLSKDEPLDTRAELDSMRLQDQQKKRQNFQTLAEQLSASQNQVMQSFQDLKAFCQQYSIALGELNKKANETLVLDSDWEFAYKKIAELNEILNAFKKQNAGNAFENAKSLIDQQEKLLETDPALAKWVSTMDPTYPQTLQARKAALIQGLQGVKNLKNHEENLKYIDRSIAQRQLWLNKRTNSYYDERDAHIIPYKPLTLEKSRTDQILDGIYYAGQLITYGAAMVTGAKGGGLAGSLRSPGFDQTTKSKYDKAYAEAMQKYEVKKQNADAQIDLWKDEAKNLIKKDNDLLNRSKDPISKVMAIYADAEQRVQMAALKKLDDLESTSDTSLLNTNRSMLDQEEKNIEKTEKELDRLQKDSANYKMQIQTLTARQEAIDLLSKKNSSGRTSAQQLPPLARAINLAEALIKSVEPKDQKIDDLDKKIKEEEERLKSSADYQAVKNPSKEQQEQLRQLVAQRTILEKKGRDLLTAAVEADKWWNLTRWSKSEASRKADQELEDLNKKIAATSYYEKASEFEKPLESLKKERSLADKEKNREFENSYDFIVDSVRQAKSILEQNGLGEIATSLPKGIKKSPENLEPTKQMLANLQAAQAAIETKKNQISKDLEQAQKSLTAVQQEIRLNKKDLGNLKDTVSARKESISTLERDLRQKNKAELEKRNNQPEENKNKDELEQIQSIGGEHSSCGNGQGNCN
jgi:hypothetical protein